MSVKMKNIEQTMRTLRALRGWTQTQAAKKAGISLGTLRACERGVQGVSAGILAQVLEVYGVDLDQALRPSQDQLFRAVFPGFAEKHGIQDYEGEVAVEPPGRAKVPFGDLPVFGPKGRI